MYKIELVNKCNEYNLNSTGTKKILIDRINKYNELNNKNIHQIKDGIEELSNNDSSEYSDDDSSEYSDEESKLYTPKELNDILLNKTKQISLSFNNITIIGDAIEFKIWKRAGMNFKICNNDI